MKPSIEKTAHIADGKSQRCAKCSLHPCTLPIADACGKAFTEGFRKGAEWKRKQLKTDNR